MTIMIIQSQLPSQIRDNFRHCYDDCENDDLDEIFLVIYDGDDSDDDGVGRGGKKRTVMGRFG